ncbi:unnamed protein product [Schistocephalus solidus]|uniref:Secreted protein n=1 Tax=Schistocephalus solidus TaxID=70667 RepID=A0A183SXX4_SCHSO|nr:unnamed protein product [Schistocephalus solidus]
MRLIVIIWFTHPRPARNPARLGLVIVTYRLEPSGKDNCEDLSSKINEIHAAVVIASRLTSLLNDRRSGNKDSVSKFTLHTVTHATPLTWCGDPPLATSKPCTARLEPVNERMACVRLKGYFKNISIVSMYAPTSADEQRSK